MSKYSSTQSEQITKIASYLQQQRVKQGLSIEQIASTTFIRLPMLKALEAGNIEQLPELIYVQGFIRRYGEAVNIDGQALSHQITANDAEKPEISANLVDNPLVESSVGQNVPPTLVHQDTNKSVAVASKARTLPHPSQETVESSGVSWLKRLQLYWIYLLVLGAAIAGLFYLFSRPPIAEKTAQTQGTQTVTTATKPQENPEPPKIVSPQKTQPVTTVIKAQETPQPPQESSPETKPKTIISSDQPSSILEPIPETPKPTETTTEPEVAVNTTPTETIPERAITQSNQPTEISPEPIATETNEATPEMAIKAALQLEGDSWLQVQVDGKTEYEGILEKGSQQSWDAQENLIIRAGNAGAVKLSVNNKPAELLGQLGEVKKIEITPDS